MANCSTQFDVVDRACTGLNCGVNGDVGVTMSSRRTEKQRAAREAYLELTEAQFDEAVGSPGVPGQESDVATTGHESVGALKPESNQHRH